DLAATYIQQQFQQAGLQPFEENYEQHFDLKISLAWVQATNIIGVLEGSDPLLKNEYIVLGAHYDHLGYKKDRSTFYPGADDNASGVATLIELAKHFGQLENKPKRSLLFIAFDAEESGLLGSKHFVKNLDSCTLVNIKAIFSFDMVGMLESNEGLDLKGIGSLVNWPETVKKHASHLKVLNPSKEIEDRTDSEPFGSN